MIRHRFIVDFQKVDDLGRLVSATGRWKEIEAHGVILEEGLRLHVYDADELVIGIRDDLIADVVATYDPEEQRWALAILDDTLGHESDFRLSRAAAELEAYGEAAGS